MILMEIKLSKKKLGNNNQNLFAIIPNDEYKPLISATEALLMELQTLMLKSDATLTDEDLTSHIDKLRLDLILEDKGEPTEYSLKERINILETIFHKERGRRIDTKDLINNKLTIMSNIIHIIIQRLNMAAVKEINKPLFKIKNLETGKYSTGGMNAKNISRNGKVWSSLSEVKKHLIYKNGPQVRDRYTDENWVVVAIDGIESPVMSVKQYYEDLDKKKESK